MSRPLDFRIDQVRLRNGVVDYADLSLVLPFSTQVTGLQGVIVGISSDPARRAGVKASGGIQPYGSARVEGSIVPFNPSRFTDLQVVFSNVLVPPLSPYTATFAGRKVESGRLWLDLDYRVDNGELLGSNDIRLAEFTLGERVEAPDAMNVPRHRHAGPGHPACADGRTIPATARRGSGPGSNRTHRRGSRRQPGGGLRATEGRRLRRQRLRQKPASPHGSSRESSEPINTFGQIPWR